LTFLPNNAVWLKQSSERVDHAIIDSLKSLNVQAGDLKEAMHYAATGGGKRIRPLLVYATASLVGKPLDQIAGIDQCAVAVELFHTYSLVHDDMPCMDDDDIRRGRATVHKVYSESTALLVGDALQTMAFGLIADSALSAIQKVKILSLLAKAGGLEGMAGGQAIDLASVGKPLERASLETMHRMKTGALLRSSVQMGGIAADLSNQELAKLDQFGSALGLLFQVVDDILDASSDSQTLGKTAGKDAAANKPTFVSLMGLTSARRLSEELYEEAIACLSIWGENAQLLKSIAGKVLHRDS
jgi:farnesyl diphosphate synthase